jgi:hypothetical protein
MNRFPTYVLLLALGVGLAGSRARADETNDSDNRDVRLTRVEGTVYVHLLGQPDGQFAPAEANAALEEGDEIRTGQDGTAEVAMDGESVIEVQPGSDFTVGSLAPAHTEFHLGLGALIAKLKSLLPSQQMRFDTPTAVAAVRGTELGLSQEENQPGHVGVFDEGHVAVSGVNGGGEVTVGPGQETELREGAAPALPHPLRALSARRARMDNVRGRAAQVGRGWRRRTPAEHRALRTRMRGKATVPAASMKNMRPSLRQNDVGRPAGSVPRQRPGPGMRGANGGPRRGGPAVRRAALRGRRPTGLNARQTPAKAGPAARRRGPIRRRPQKAAPAEKKTAK